MISDEKTKLRANEKAWEDLHGYETTSGCPCWDEVEEPCIPKGSGWGYNLNCYYFCGWCCP